MFRVYLFALEGSLSKLDVLNQIYNIMLNITIPCRHNGLLQLIDNWLPLQNYNNYQYVFFIQGRQNSLF